MSTAETEVKIEVRDTIESDATAAGWLPEQENDPAVKCVTITQNGVPVFHLKVENVIRCQIQLPSETSPDLAATSPALNDAFNVVAGLAKSAGYSEITLESEDLSNLFAKLGLEAVENTFRVKI